MLRRGLMAGNISGAEGVAFDPSNTAASIALSGGNRTATGIANSGGITRSVTGKSSGKWYAEAVNPVFSSAGTNGCGTIGLVTAGEALTNWLGQGAGAYGLWNVGGVLRTYFAGASNAAGMIGANPTQVLMLAWDADAGRVWCGVNGTWLASGDPAAGASPRYDNPALQGLHYLASGPRNTGNQVVLQATPNYAPPSGFSFWT